MKWAAAALVMAAACAAAPAFADGFTPEWCAVNRNQTDSTRISCADASWCKAHWNDDHIARIACDPFRSKADARLPFQAVSCLTLGHDLNAAEETALCVRPSAARYRTAMGCTPSPMGVGGDGLLPDGMDNARLAIRAHLVTWTFSATVVRIGIGPLGAGRISVAAPENGTGPYRHWSAALTEAEVDRLLAALNRSRFWQLPHLGGHLGGTDGPIASIEVSVPGRRNYVTDSLGGPGAVDLSILARAISTIVSAHGKGI